MNVFINKNIVRYILIFILIIILNANLILAAGWYAGDLHRHTGFSTQGGYPGESNSECSSETYDPTGYTVAQLKDQVNNAGATFWLSLTDHSYCLTSSEWDIVANDASTYSDSSVLFLASEELTVEEDCAGGGDEILCGGDSAGHLGAHGISSFIESEFPDAPNGWCPEWPDSQASINNINNDGGIPIINHPATSAWDWESIGIHGGGS